MVASVHKEKICELPEGDVVVGCFRRARREVPSGKSELLEGNVQYRGLPVDASEINLSPRVPASSSEIVQNLPRCCCCFLVAAVSFVLLLSVTCAFTTLPSSPRLFVGSETRLLRNVLMIAWATRSPNEVTMK